MSINLYIDGTDQTSDLAVNTISIRNQLQQRADSMNFTLNDGATVPTEHDLVRFFRTDTIASFSTKTVTLDGNYEKGTNFFYPGQVLKIRIGDSDEEDVTVDTYDEDTLQIVLVDAPSGSVSQGDKIGFILFGGTVSKVTVSDEVYKSNIEYNIQWQTCYFDVL